MTFNYEYIVRKFRHLFLNSIAYYILEPMFKSGNWRIRNNVKAQLKESLEIVYSNYEKAFLFFRKANVCSKCSIGYSCCTGAFNRFTVYDHIDS